MMALLEYEGWRIRHDRETTTRANAQLSGYDVDGCCPDCDNFVAARHLAYPPEFCALLDRLGIPADHEALVYVVGPYEAGLYAYSGWFHFVGSIEHDPLNVGAILPIDVEGQGFRFWFHGRPALVPDAFHQVPVVQLEFTTWVPWLLGDEVSEEG